MSREIDERVVSMRFDNKNFEQNVSTTLSTLEKLKRSLHLDGAARGLKEINAAAAKVDMSGLCSSAEKVGLKFNAMYTIADQALRNMTNSVYYAGKRMISALTFDPIKTGFNEYETKMNSIQTIMSNTASKGETMASVTKVIDELNTYADKTIYNFQEMTRNIGTFTAAGVGLKESAAAIQGIANLAAMSGSSSQQASTAMYQLSQALAAGTVKLMDWNSVVNAGMGGEKFQEALKSTAREMGIAVDSIIKDNGSFRDSLREGWLTADVLNTTLKKFTKEGAAEYSAAMVKAGKYTQEQADALVKEAQAAEDAATKVKTFSQLWDTMKEAAQSGWGQTWEIIIGNFEQAKERLTELSDLFGGILGRSSDRRNNFLKGALSSNWDQLVSKLNKAGIETETFQNKIIELSGTHSEEFKKMIEEEGSFEKALKKAFSKGIVDKSVVKDAFQMLVGKFKDAENSASKMTKTLEEYEEVANKIIHGDFGNGEERMRRLAEAGYDYATAQNLVNEKLGSSVRHLSSLSEEELKNADSLAKLSDEQLKNKGYTDDQIEALRELQKQADDADSSIYKLINGVEKASGAELIWSSLFNVIYSIIEPLKAVRLAWTETFGELDSGKLYNVIENINAFTSSIREFATNKDNLDKITRSFKGLFAIVDIFATIAGGGLRLAFKALSMILQAFDLNILDATATIGDAIVAFKEWLFENNLVVRTLENLISKIPEAVKYLKDMFSAFKEIPVVQKFIKSFEKVTDLFSSLKTFNFGSIDWKNTAKELASSIREFLSTIPDAAAEIGGNIVEGLNNGILDKARTIFKGMVEFANTIIDTFREVLGIHSPSTVFFEFGQNIVEGLVNGIASAISLVINGFKMLGDKIVDIFSKIELGKINDGFSNALSDFGKLLGKFDYAKLLAIIPIGAVLIMIKKIYDFTSALADGINGFNEVLGEFANIEKQFAGILKAKKWDIYAEALKKIATAIAILVGAVIAMTFVDPEKLYRATVTVGLLSGILVGLAFAMDKLSSASVRVGKDGVNLDGFKTGLLSIGASLVLLALTVKLIGSLKPDQAKQGFIGLAGLVVAIGGVFAAYGLLVKGKSAQNIDKAGKMLLKLSFSMLLLIGVIKLVGGLSTDEMIKGGIFMAAFTAFVGALVFVTQSSGKRIDKVGGMLVKMSLAMILLAGVCKLVGMLSPEEMFKGGAFAAAFLLFVGILVKITQLDSQKQIAKLGGLLLSISVSLMLMVGVCKLVNMLSLGEMLKGAAFVAAFVIFVKVLVQITTIGSEQKIAKVAATLIAMSIAIGMLAAIAILLSMMPLEGLAKGVIAVSTLGLVMAAMIKATKGATKSVGNIVAMTIAIGVMAGAVAALSTIDGTKLAGATIALGSLMYIFSLIAKSSGTIGKAMGSLLIMTIAIGMLGGMLYILSDLPIDSVLGISASLSLLMFSLSTSLKIISKAGVIAPSALISIGIMTLIVGMLGGILYLLKDLPADSTLSIVTSLSILLLALSGTCLILSAVGATGPAAFIGIGALATLIVGIGGLMVAIGALADHFPKMEEFLNKGIPILEKIGYGLGSFLGNIVGGLTDGLTSGLPEIGNNLSTFMTNLDPFIEGAKKIDETSINGVTALVKMISSLSGANIMESISSFLTGSSSIETFSSSLTAFGDAIVGFSEKVAGKIDEEDVLAAANAGKMLAEMQSMITGTGGVIEWFVGKKNLADFGAQLQAFGDAIVGFSAKVSEEGAINEEAVNAAVNAGKLMASLQGAIEPSGGVMQWLAGEKNLSNFGSQLIAFGAAIVGFSAKVSEEGAINEEAVNAAANAGKIMIEMSKAIVPSGGVLQWLAGEKNMATFGSQLVLFGQAIVNFSKKVSEGINEEAVTAAANAGRIMSELQKNLVSSGGVVQFFTGKKNLDTFGNQLVAYGDAVTKFSEKVSGNIDEESVTAAANTGRLMVELQKAIPEKKWLDGKVSLSEFGGDLASFGEQFAIYASNVSDVNTESVSGVISNIKDLSKTINSMSEIDTSGVSKFTEALKSLANIDLATLEASFSNVSVNFFTVGMTIIDSLVNGMNSKQFNITTALSTLMTNAVNAINSKKAAFLTAGTGLMTQLISGITKSGPKVTIALGLIMATAVIGIRSYYNSFYSAGGYLVEGFAAGITANTFAAEAAAAAMARAALAAAMAELDINSPSKVFMKVGGAVPEGFAKGITKFGYFVDSAITSMADGALSKTSNVVSRISDAINFSIDSQPTIRPVLDLSGISNGANALSGMLDMNSHLGLIADTQSISSMMNRRIQNDGNSEIISAINGLRKDLANTKGDTYTIEGITYDDGTNVSDAVKELVRAAKVERRK
jgi:tape measure domain-containing protein